MTGREWKPGDVAVATLRGKLRLLRFKPFDDNGDPIERPWVMDSTYERGDYVASNWLIDDPQLSEVRFLDPPKPVEPLGLGAVVEDADGRTWVRVALGKYGWVEANSMGQFRDDFNGSLWAKIPAVRILAEGVTA